MKVVWNTSLKGKLVELKWVRIEQIQYIEEEVKERDFNQKDGHSQTERLIVLRGIYKTAQRLF
ncbi:hypothetical protein A9168_01755 [Macellibacteroides sp. HH-ZS]|nr:hypothetical protein A9168_01755 [Macellibacteroides sp. HH-ZS]